jgi:hypothetical protein
VLVVTMDDQRLRSREVLQAFSRPLHLPEMRKLQARSPITTEISWCKIASPRRKESRRIAGEEVSKIERQAHMPAKSLAAAPSPQNVINLMDALKRSLAAEQPVQRAASATKPTPTRSAAATKPTPAKRPGARTRRTGYASMPRIEKTG